MSTMWWTALQTELERARRFRREFALLRVRRSARRSFAGRPFQRRRSAELAHLDRLHSSVRSIDTVWADGSSTYILLPETTRGTALRVVERLRSATPEVFTDASVAVVTFPADALTAGALLDKLEEVDRIARARARVEAEAAFADLEADLRSSGRSNEPGAGGRAQAHNAAREREFSHLDPS